MKLASTILAAALTFAGSQIAMSQLAKAADVNAISGGAFKQVLNALVAQYEKESGNKVIVTYQTVGQHLKLIASGQETFDVAVLTPEAIDGLTKEGKVVAGSRADLAKTGVGVVVKAGAPLPDISTRGGVQARAAGGKVGRLYRSGGRRLERNLRRQAAGTPRHRQGGQRQGGARARRRSRQPHRRWRG